MTRSRAYRSTSVKDVALSRVLSGREGEVAVAGCDLSKEEIRAVLRWGDRDFERPWKAANPGEIGVLIDTLKQVERVGGVVVALEPTGTYGDPFRQALSDAGLVTHRVSPKASHDYAEIFDGVPSQHDGKDAAIVAELCALGKSREWAYSPASEAEREMANWVDWHDAQRGILNGWYGRLEALLARYWPEATQVLPVNSGSLLRSLAHYGGPLGLGSDAQALSRLVGWGGHYLSREKAQQLVIGARNTLGVRQGKADVAQVKQYAELALSCRREMEQARRALAKLAQDHPVIQAQTPIVGLMTACVLWVCLGDPAMYDCGEAYRKAMGLNLTEFSSGTWHGRIRISKRGHSMIRRWLYFAALRWIRTEPIKSWYENKKSKKSGKGDDQVMRAIVGVMRKLALALYRVSVSDAAFDPNLLFPGARICKAA